jgi:hypothetical protein
MEILAGSLLTPDTVNPTDYPIQDTDIEKIGHRGNRSHITLDQRDLSPNGGVSCFYAAAFKMVADTYELTPDEKKVAYQAFKDGWANIVAEGKVIPGIGGRFGDGVDAARRAFNAAFPTKRVRTYRGLLPRFDVDSNLHLHFYRAMFQGWMAMFGGYIGNDFSADLLDGTINDDEKPVGEGVYGHARNMFGWKSSPGSLGGTVTVDDNYGKMPNFPNRYQMDDLETKVKNGQVMGAYYLSLPA